MPGTRLHTTTELVGVASGVLLVADVAVITAIDGSFGLTDSVLFLSGFAGLFLLAALVGVLVSASHAGARRLLVALGSMLALVAALTLLSTLADATSHALYSGGNKGLHDECGIFALGLGALAIALALHLRAGAQLRVRRPQADAVTAFETTPAGR